MIRRLKDIIQNGLIFLLASPGDRQELADWAQDVTAHARRQNEALTISDAARDRIRTAVTGGDREVKP